MDMNVVLAEHQYFETKRLTLRKIELTDSKAIYEYARDPEVVRYVTFEAHDSLERTKEGIANYFLPNRLSTWAIVDKMSKKLIGTIDLRVTADSASFGWILNKQYWGRGLMPEAASCLRDFAFNDLKLTVLTADHFADNPKSGCVMQKIGMKKMGQLWIYVAKLEQSVLCDYWALTKAEYENKAR